VRVLMLSKACVVGAYQRKLEALVALSPTLELTVAVPPAWAGVPLERAHTRGYRLEVLPLAFDGHFHLHFYPTLGRLLRQVDPQLVHIDEEPYNLATFHAAWLARRHSAKTLWFSWQNLERRYLPPFAWWERSNLRRSDYAIVGSQTAAAVWRAKGYTGPLAVIPQFGVDPDIYTPSTTPRPAGPPHIVYAGRLVPEKGVDVLLRALAGLPGAWRLTLLGSGPEEGALRSLAARLGLREQVDFHPPIPSTETPTFYQQADVLVLPSRTRPNWQEQFGRVLIEAMACGVPVIGAASGEIPHVIGPDGLLFPEDDTDALRAALAQLLDDPDLRHDLGARGRARVLVHFTQERIAAQTLAVYQELLSC